MSSPEDTQGLVVLTVSADDRRVRVRRLPDYETVRTSCAEAWPAVPGAFPQVMVPPLLDAGADDACVFVVTRDGSVHHVPLDGRAARPLEDVTWEATRPFAVAGDGRAVAAGARIVTVTGARFDLESDGAKVGAVASAPDGFLVAREAGRDWICERVVVTPDGLRVASSVSWVAPAWLAEAQPRADAAYFTRIAPQLSDAQPLVLLLPAPTRGAPWIVRVEPNGEQTPIVQDWFDAARPAVVVGDELHYFSFDELRRVALKAHAQREGWPDLDAVVARLGGTPSHAQAHVKALARHGQAALVRVDGLPDAGADWELALVSRDGVTVERTRLTARESLGGWMLPAPSR